ncbi:MAG: hypothetical protein QF778_11070, partial [SAR324 cluster bacterium]|nr:hypothetical protein [SAR324 cluster bacterium]
NGNAITRPSPIGKSKNICGFIEVDYIYINQLSQKSYTGCEQRLSVQLDFDSDTVLALDLFFENLE